MVKVIDQRPTRVDSLRKLITQVKTPASVPHGVKVARPGEGVRFFDSEGAGHLWDGDAIASFDSRMGEAEAKLAEAEAALEQATAELEDAKGRIDAAGGDLSAYIEKVETAQAAATKAANDLKALDSRLASADSSLKALTSRVGTTETRAGELSTAVDNALTQSSSAGSLASEAMGKAEDAAAEAARVSADAANAVSAAEEAERKALEAAGIAGGKGKVIYSASGPTGADQHPNNLWIRSSDNRPHRWSGSAWVAVTDKAATDAASAAVSAQAKADKAERDAAAAKAVADQARAEAAAAQASAVSADGKAQQAIASAQQAQGTADKAVSDAAKAATAASAADQKALDAAGLAGSKGKVIYSATAPTGADRAEQNLWIRTTDNRPHRWSGSAWVAVTDKVATDAAASAAAANTLASQAKAAADKAQADATRAATQAQDAMRAANLAQDSANGKNTVSYTTGNPAGVGTRLGDTHYKVNAAGTVLAWWRWSGSAWVEQALDGQVISSLDAGKITAGWLDAARIKAGSITADKMLIGIGDNLVPNGNGMGVEGWEAFGRNSNPEMSNGNPGSFWVLGRKNADSARFPIRPGLFRFRVDARTSVPSGARFYVQILFFRGDTQLAAPYPVVNQILTTSYQIYTGQVTAPAGTDSYSIRVYSMHPNGTVDETKHCWYTGFEMREIRDGTLIVNGSITGQQIHAQSVGAVVGEFVQVRAQNVEITGELVGRVVNAMSAQHKNLVVTESALLQHAVLLGTTVAEQLNITKKLIARDAIVDGTLDVAQLNVTVGMAAAIVNAMDVNAKKLVVTKEAILNQVTVIESIVTPELIAQKISVQDLGAKLISTTALQTDTAANRGVKITSTGINAWDSAGRQTIRLNGVSNLLTGDFATGDDSGGRIRAFTGQHPVNGRPYGFLTFHDVGGYTGKQGVIEFNDNQMCLSVKDGHQQGHAQPFRKGLIVTSDGATLAGNLSLEGLFKKSPALQAIAISFGNIPAGHYKEVTQPVTRVNGQNPYSLIQMSSHNLANLSAVAWTVDGTVKIRVYNNSGFEATHVWCDLVLLGLER